jgi:NADP-dependent 3-hydroxy acid dehydrogenase YdfG
LKSRIDAAGGVAEVVAGDVTDEGFAKGLVDQTVKRFGRLDILINSAGIMHPDNVENANIPLWKESMDLNLFATLYTCTAAIPVMKAQGEGDIVNISSTAGRRMMGGPYGTSKIALNSFHEALRNEVSLQGIRCCIIEPGATTSEIWDKVTDPKYRDFLKQHVNKEGAMKPEDIAACIVLALSLPRRANIAEILIRPTIDVTPGVGG